MEFEGVGVGRELGAGVEVGEEVVDGLGENAGPVYGVDCAEAMFFVEGTVAEEGFYDILAREE